MKSLWPLPPPPEVETVDDLETGLPQYRVRCPWCVYDTGWCISWIATWGYLADHHLETHYDVRDVVRQRWGMRPSARDRRDRSRPIER